MYDKMASIEVSKNMEQWCVIKFGGIKLRSSDIFWRVKITVWG
jgi:hypothetical protein